MWLIISCLLSYNQHLLFCRVLSTSALTQLVLIASLCPAIRGNSVSFFRFLFLSHVQVLSCEISLLCRLKYPYICFSSNFCFLVITVMLCDDTPSAPWHINFFAPFHFLAGDQLVVPIGGYRTFLYGYKKYNREWEKRNKRTKRTIQAWG